jgi:hypothetical protein
MTIIGAGNQTDRCSIPLATSNRRRIPNEQRMQRDPSSMAAARDMHLSAHPLWRVRSLRSTYNCMGLVFASRRTWIDPEHFNMIVGDDGYVERSNRNEAVAGDHAVYRNSTNGNVIHVGCIVEVRPDLKRARSELIVISQFGANGEYIHEADDLPGALRIGVSSLSLSVWTEAKIL